MGSNGDLVREATMRRVRRHIRTGLDAGRDPGEVVDEVVGAYALTPVEAGLAWTMALGQGSRRAAAPRRGASGRKG